MFSRHQTARFRTLKRETEAAKAKQAAYLLKLKSLCDHSLTTEESWGGEDTLGNYAPESATHVWHCALCGEQLLIHEGRLGGINTLPDEHPARNTVSTPKLVRDNVPQTREELEKLLEKEASFAAEAEGRGFHR